MKRLILALATLGILFIGSTAPALALNVFNNVSCGSDTANTAVCQDQNQTTNPITGPKGVIMKVTNILAIIAGIAAVIIIVVAGVQYMTSAGDSNATAGAKNTIVGALIGLAVIALARTLIAFVVSKV